MMSGSSLTPLPRITSEQESVATTTDVVVVGGGDASAAATTSAGGGGGGSGGGGGGGGAAGGLNRTNNNNNNNHNIKRLPSSKRFGFNSRENSDYKWQRARGVVGALEVASEPTFDFIAPLQPRFVPGREPVFQDALALWESLQLQPTFVQACQHMPVGTCCCGIIQDNDTTIKEAVTVLNENWAKAMNKKLLERGFKVECFLWNWQNASGKTETNILLIRFFELSSYRLRRASRDSLDLELEVADDDQAGAPTTTTATGTTTTASTTTTTTTTSKEKADHNKNNKTLSSSSSSEPQPAATVERTAWRSSSRSPKSSRKSPKTSSSSSSGGGIQEAAR
jgi:hypothetical protein